MKNTTLFIAAVMAVLFSSCVFAQDEFFHSTYLEMLHDQQLERCQTDYARITNENVFEEPVCYEVNRNCLKILTRNESDFQKVANAALFLPTSMDVQIVNKSGYYDGVADVWIPRKFAVCMGRGQVVTQSDDSNAIVMQSPLFQILNWFGRVEEANSMAVSAESPSIFAGQTQKLVHVRDEAEAKVVEFFHGVDSSSLETVEIVTEGGITVNMFAIPQDPTDQPTTGGGPSTGGGGTSGGGAENCPNEVDCEDDAENDNVIVYQIRKGTKAYAALKGDDAQAKQDVIDSLCNYKNLVEAQLSAGKCFKVYDAYPEKKSACGEAWRTIARVHCFPKKKNEGDTCWVKDGWHRGHIPDGCAGGTPSPGGCWIPQIGPVNSGLGSQCGRLKGQCYNTINFVVGEVKTVDKKKVFCEDENCKVTCPELESDEVLDLIDEVLAPRKKRWDECICEFIEMNKDAKSVDDLKPAEYKNWYKACVSDTILPRKAPAK